MEQNCYNCKFRGYSTLKSPCSTGVYQMRYSHICFQWKERTKIQKFFDEFFGR